MSLLLPSAESAILSILKKHLPYFILLATILSLPCAYLNYTQGDAQFLSSEWFLRELITSLMIPIAAHFTAHHARIASEPLGIIKSFFFYAGLWMVFSLTRSGIFNFPEPILSLFTYVTLLCSLSCLYHYFYTPYLLIKLSFDEALSKSKELIAQAPFRPFRFIITSFLIATCLRLIVKSFDPALETSVAVTFDTTASFLSIFLSALLAANTALSPLSPQEGTTPPHKYDEFAKTIFAPRGILILSALLIVLWQTSASQLRAMPPSATIQVLQAKALPDEIRLTLHVTDTEHHLRGFYPALFALAGTQKNAFGETAIASDFFVAPPAQLAGFKIKPTYDATLQVSLRKSPLSPELWRTPEEFKKLTDLTLWYGDTKIGVITLE